MSKKSRSKLSRQARRKQKLALIKGVREDNPLLLHDCFIWPDDLVPGSVNTVYIKWCQGSYDSNDSALKSIHHYSFIKHIVFIISYNYQTNLFSCFSIPQHLSKISLYPEKDILINYAIKHIMPYLDQKARPFLLCILGDTNFETLYNIWPKEVHDNGGPCYEVECKWNGSIDRLLKRMRLD